MNANRRFGFGWVISVGNTKVYFSKPWQILSCVRILSPQKFSILSHNTPGRGRNATLNMQLFDFPPHKKMLFPIINMRRSMNFLPLGSLRTEPVIYGHPHMRGKETKFHQKLCFSPSPNSSPELCFRTRHRSKVFETRCETYQGDY